MVTNQKAASLLSVRITAIPFISNFFPSLQLLAWFFSVYIHVLYHIQQSSIPLCALQTWATKLTIKFIKIQPFA